MRVPLTASLEIAGGGTIDLDLHRWRSEPDDVELELLRVLAPPVLDVGCGPGRLAAALAARGALALGIDPAPSAADEATRRGAPVLQRSVFGDLPGEGRWATALLADGNVGIGGDPRALLRRLRALLRTGGAVVAEVLPPGTPSGSMTVRIAGADGTVSPWFPWATVAADTWAVLADEAGFSRPSAWQVGERWFATAVKP